MATATSSLASRAWQTNFFGVGCNESGATLYTLKHKNILLCHSKSSMVKVIDFGSSCRISLR